MERCYRVQLEFAMFIRIEIQSVMNEEQIINAALCFKTCTLTLSNAFEFGAARYRYYLKVSKYCRTTFHSIISYSSYAYVTFSVHDIKSSYCVETETEM